MVFEKWAIGQLVKVETEEGDIGTQVLNPVSFFNTSLLYQLLTYGIEISGIAYAVCLLGIKKEIGVVVAFAEGKFQLRSS